MKKSFFLTERKQEVKPEQASKGESGVLFFSGLPCKWKKTIQVSILALTLKAELSLWELLPLSGRWREEGN